MHYSYNECIPELSIHQDAFKIMKLSSLRNSPCPIHSTQNFHFEKDPKDDRTSGFHSELLYQISAPPIKDHPVKQAFSPLRETSARTLNHVYEKRIDQLCTLTLFIWRAKSKKNPPSLQAPTFTSSSFLLIVSQKFAGAVQQRKDFKAALPPPYSRKVGSLSTSNPRLVPGHFKIDPIGTTLILLPEGKHPEYHRSWKRSLQSY